MTHPEAFKEDVEQVAIVGIGCKLPGANDLASLAKVLNKHDSCISTVAYHGKAFGYASLLDEEDRNGFDPKFWGLTPAQASAIDPQTRWILEGVWNAILDSRAVGIESLSKLKVGVYCGVMNNDIVGVREAAGVDFSLNSTPGSIAGFVAHMYGFRGPALDVNTMCSSGLVCLDLAVEALRSGSCDVAFVAAANWVGGASGFRDIGSVNALSPDGLQDCLGSLQNGYVRGEGMVVLMLQRTCDVHADETIRCIVQSVGSTHHGKGGSAPPNVTVSTNVAAPIPESYTNSYAKCFDMNHSIVKEDTVYLEMHATGTKLGDAAEIQSVENFYTVHQDDGQTRDPKRRLYLGANKSMFGHTEPVSGLLSIVKLAVAFQTGVMPPTLLVTDTSDSLQRLEKDCNVRVVQAPTPLDVIVNNDDLKEKALFGITSSGMSGTTTHVLLRRPSLLRSEENSRAANENAPPLPRMVTIQTHSAASCKDWGDAIANASEGEAITSDVMLPKQGFLRSAPPGASKTICSFSPDFKMSKEQMREQPSLRSPPEALPQRTKTAGIVLAFGGVGLVKYGVGRDLYHSWPSFRGAVDKVDNAFRTAPQSLFHDKSVARMCGMIECPENESQEIGHQLGTELMQVTTFLVQYAQSEALIQDFHVKIEGVIGHSFGEIVACAVTGAISLEAAIQITLVRTETSLELERRWQQPMGMLMCGQLSLKELTQMLPRSKADKHGIIVKDSTAYLSGYIAENELLLSGIREDLESVASALGEHQTAAWVDSAIPFHSPFVDPVAGAVADVIAKMSEDGKLFDAKNGSVPSFMTSKGRIVELESLRSVDFWRNSTTSPIYLQDTLSSMAQHFTGKETAMFDMSPRGLFVQWFKRNGKSWSEKRETEWPMGSVVSAPVFSWDFVRVLQHFRPRAISRTITSTDVGQFMPAFPFGRRNCSTDFASCTVQKLDVQTVPSSSVFSTHNTLSIRYMGINHGSTCKTRPEECIGIELHCRLGEDTMAPWGDQEAKGSVLNVVNFRGKDAFLDDINRCYRGNGQLVLLVFGPRSGENPVDGWAKDHADLKQAIDVVVALQDVMVAGWVKGIVLVSGDPSHAAFEFIAGAAATLRLQVPTLEFVSTLRLEDNAKFDSSNRDSVLKAAEMGEAVMRITSDGSLEAQRVFPQTQPLSWDTSWLKQDKLYIVSGATSGIAHVILPALALSGIRHFLLLVHSRGIDEFVLKQMKENCAKTVMVKKCNVSDEAMLDETIQTALRETGLVRVAGVFHLAGIDMPTTLPSPRDVIENIVQVKYQGLVNLRKCARLQPGDICSVAGSVSTLIGSSGVAYAAVNHACRALQIQASQCDIVAPYPLLGISEHTWGTSSLWHGETKEKFRAQIRNAGMKPCASPSFAFGMMHPAAIPSEADGDLGTIRFDYRKAHDFVNATSPNLVFEEMVKSEEARETTPIVEILGSSETNVNHTNSRPTAESSSPRLETPYDALIQAISDVAGLSIDEVTSSASEDSFLDETFAIDSISSIQLGRRLRKLGFNVLQDTIASSTFGMVLENMTAMPHTSGVLPSDQEGPGKENTSEVNALTSSKSSAPTTEIEVIEGSNLPVSEQTMKAVAFGHDVASGPIIPSLWYLMVGVKMLGANVKVDLYRMSSTSIERTYVERQDSASRTILTFHTKHAGKDPLIRCQVSSSADTQDPLPLIVPADEQEPPVFALTSEDIYDQWARSAGFAYGGPYRSLDSLKMFGDFDRSDAEASILKCRLLSKGRVILPDDAALNEAHAFFVLIDAGLHPSFLQGATLAPAKLAFTAHVPVEEWVGLLAANGMEFSVSSRFNEATSSAWSITASLYIGSEPVSTCTGILKGIPDTVGWKPYANMFLQKPCHTLVCFHEAGGTSRIFESLSHRLASHQVRVLTVDFPQHGRRAQQTEDDIVTTLKNLLPDVMPWLRQQLTMVDGTVVPFSVLGMSSGGVAAFGVVRDGLFAEGLIPKALITMTSQPPHIPNQHAERTYQTTKEQVEHVLIYYSVLSGVSLLHLNEGQETADRIRSVLGVVHDLTTDPATIQKPLSIPTYVYGLVDDPVVPWETLKRWKQVLEPGCLVGGEIRPLDKKLNHFLGLTGLAEEAFEQIFFQDGVLTDLLGGYAYLALAKRARADLRSS